MNLFVCLFSIVYMVEWDLLSWKELSLGVGCVNPGEDDLFCVCLLACFFDWLIVFWDKISLHRTGCPQTCSDPPVSTSWVLRLQACITICGSQALFLKHECVCAHVYPQPGVVSVPSERSLSPSLHRVELTVTEMRSIQPRKHARERRWGIWSAWLILLG